MPDMSLIRVRGTLASQDMERRELNVLDAADWPTIVPVRVDIPTNKIGAIIEGL